MTDDALKAKIGLFDELTDEIENVPEITTYNFLNPFDGDIDDFPVGEFISIDRIRLRWVNEGWFEYLPDGDTPFAFKRNNGEIITPEKMYTDGGSIPRAFWIMKGLSPWEYGPSYLIHDWEFDLHHCN
ncbi:MAG: hypothetical protein JRF25_09615, partial [Deltaproteobacteria bacterium]|nr:hypothetical protein [Deltaproteobacteria bacterium]